MVVAVHTLVDIRFGLYSHDWRFASVPDLVRIVLAVVSRHGDRRRDHVRASSLVRPDVTDKVPLPFWPVELLLALAVVGGLRFGDPRGV